MTSSPRLKPTRAAAFLGGLFVGSTITTITIIYTLFAQNWS